jgi:PAS domain S-box-containing protein
VSLKRLWEAATTRSGWMTADEARAYLAAIVESSDDAILSKSLHGIIQSCNAAGERLFGYRAEELIGRPINILIPADRQSEEPQILERIRRGERVDHFETVRLTKSGRLVEVSVTISPIRDAAGRIIGASKIARDITDRKRAEAALRRAQQVSRFLANTSVALTDLSDPRTILRKAASLAVPFFADWCAVDLTSDDGMERLLVMHSEAGKEAHAREVACRWLPVVEDAVGPGWVARTGRPEHMDDIQERDFVPWVREDEHWRVLREMGFASYVSVPVSWGRKVRAVLTFVRGEPERSYEASDVRVAEDLAQRAGVAIENAVLYHTALEADRRKDDFLAMLSHELRTPLNAIVGWSHILRDGKATPEVLRKAVDTIHRNAQVQTQLISDILDISRIAAGKMRLDAQPLELPLVIEAALDTLKPAADARRVCVDTALDPRAGPISGDAGRLQQVVWNLVSNAIKFVPERTGRVQVRLESVDSHVRLTVADNGPGIDPAFLPHVFERFWQADRAATRRHQGLGLGLAIVRQVVELHGGTIRADNRDDGTGAIFTVTLPIRAVDAPVSAAEPLAEHAQQEQPLWLEAAPSLRGVRVLVVDDQPDSRDLLKAVLERCGAEVSVAASSRQALEIVPRGRPDVVLSDLEMPEEDGFEMLRRLRALPPDMGGRTPAAAVTAYASARDRVKALRAGFQMHIPKPVLPAEIATVVASLAGKPVA